MIETGREIVNGVPKLINVLSGRLSSIAAGMFSYPRKDVTIKNDRKGTCSFLFDIGLGFLA